MKMEILKNDLLPAPAVSLLSTKVPETPDTNNTKERVDELFLSDEIEEDEELLLRFSDDEEVKQDNTSGQIENQQIEKLDTNEDDCNFNKNIDSSSEERSTLELTKLTALVNEDSSGINSLDEKSSSENCNLNEEDLTMSGSDRIPPLMHNSPKYWTNNFDKRWKGVNSSRGRHHFSHRNSNDWYNQQYPDKDKFNGRNNYNNQNKHFNQQKKKGKFSSQPRENCELKNSEKETEKSTNLKASLSDVDTIINDMNKIIQENGDCNELESKENNFTAENENACKKDTSSTEECSDKKESECNSECERLSNEKCKDSDNTKHNITSECEPTNCKKDDSSVTKDCDTTVSVLEKVTNKPEPESDSVNLENKFSSSVLENPDIVAKDDSKDLSDSSGLSSKQDSSIESNVNIAKASHDDDATKETEDQNTTLKDQSSEHEEAKDEDNKYNGNGDLKEDAQDDEKIETEKSFGEKEQSSSTKENNDEKLSSDQEVKEKPSFSINEQSIDISELELLEHNLSENQNKADATTDGNDNTVETEKSEVPSNSVSIDDLKSRDTEESKVLTDKDEEGSSEMSSLVIDESSCSQGEKMSLDEEDEEPNESVKQSKENNSVDNDENPSFVAINASEKMTGVIEEVDLVDNESETTGSTSDNQVETNSLENKKDTDGSLTINNNTSQFSSISVDRNKISENKEGDRTTAIKRRRRKRHNTLDDVTINELTAENGVRQKRRSARNAEEMIRKEIMKDDEDDVLSDEPSRLVSVNYKKAVLHAPPLSPPSLKRTADDLEDVDDGAAAKRVKTASETPATTAPPTAVPTATVASAPSPSKEFAPVSKESSAEVKDLVRRLSTEDIRGKLKKLSQEEMEALLLQKTIECITIRGEMGKLREQARQAKINHEAARTKCQQLQKQVEGFEMVLKRINYDKNSNSDKFVPPIKITRSVGLQVNFIATMKPGVGSASSTSKTVSASPGTANMMENRPAASQASRKFMKTRSPRRVELPPSGMTQAPNPAPVTATSVVGGGGPATPTAIVMNKSTVDTAKRTITLPSSSNIVQLMAGQQPVVVNSTVGGTPSRPATITLHRPSNQQGNKSANNSNSSSSSDLIDLTDEEDKSKSPAVTPITTAISRPRVLQAFPASVTLPNSGNLRLVQAGNQVSPTSLVNNSNPPRLTTYLMQSGTNGVPRQLVLANPNTIRPVTSVATRNISTISYKGVPTLTSGGTVRVLTTQAPTANVQLSQHPAPLPDTPAVESNPLWKLSPPAPSLKISKVATGIVLSWNMDLPNNKYAEIVSYQLYAYQEVAGTSPSASLWKKVGDVRALPLPMACTLTQFSEGNNYYFAVRAVDIHSRFGQYSKPGNISL